MSITFSCPSCTSKMTVPDNLAGKRGKCSKCKGPIVVPAEANGAAAKPAPAAVGRAAPPPPQSEPVVDFEAEAAAALADAPKEERKAEFIEFKCPQCDELLKMALDLAGKRAPCPECRRIIAVPMPKGGTPNDWRNAGPKLPTGAKRDDGPAPEGAWGASAATRASTEALLEAGVIKEKEKPLTFYQKYQRLMLAAASVAVVFGGAFSVWAWMTSNQEKNALNAALSAASAQSATTTFGTGGLAALHGYAGEYFLLTNKPDCAKLAHEHYAKAATLGKDTRAADADALLIDLALAQLALGGGPEQTDTGRRLPWRDTHRLVMSTLRGVDGRDARLAAVRRLTATLVERGQGDHVFTSVNGLAGASAGERSEALAVSGLELLRLGKKDEAGKMLEAALEPWAEPKDKKEKEKKAKPPELNAAVVSLATLEGKRAPEPGKSLQDAEAQAVGLADALARQGKPDEARAKVSGLPAQDGGKLRGLIAVGAACDPKIAADEVKQALAAVSPERKRRDQDWPLLRLIEAGVAAGVAADDLEPAAAAVEDAGLASWAQLMILRGRLKAARSAEPVDSAEKIPAKTLGGMVARLELARHNTRLSHGWASAVKSWEEPAKAMGSLGVALGVQGGK